MLGANQGLLLYGEVSVMQTFCSPLAIDALPSNTLLHLLPLKNVNYHMNLLQLREL